MIYLPELYYFFDQEDFPNKKAVFVIAKYISRYCSGYEAKLLVPKNKKMKIKQEGELPDDVGNKEKSVEEVLNYLYDNSVWDMYYFKLFRNYLVDQDGVFDHHDDTCCWVLRLTKDEFKDLQKELEKNDLPADLFYQESEVICVPRKPGKIAKLFSGLGLSFETNTCYTPLRYKHRDDVKK